MLLWKLQIKDDLEKMETKKFENAVLEEALTDCKQRMSAALDDIQSDLNFYSLSWLKQSLDWCKLNCENRDLLLSKFLLAKLYQTSRSYTYSLVSCSIAPLPSFFKKTVAHFYKTDDHGFFEPAKAVDNCMISRKAFHPFTRGP